MARNLLLLAVSIALGLAAAEAVLSRARPMPLRHIRSGTTDFERAPKARWYGWANVPGETFTTNDPDGGVPPGTSFEDIPDDWFCPVCGARKADFEPYDE